MFNPRNLVPIALAVGFGVANGEYNTFTFHRKDGVLNLYPQDM